jgi:TM2 domain-containing membrane protein YozV
MPAHPVTINAPRAQVVAIAAPTPAQQPVATPEQVSCPYCGEKILAQAIKCRHCNEFLDARLRQQAQPPAPVHGQGPAPVNVVVNQHTNVLAGFNAPRWSRGAAMLLSILIPGAGQFYKGQPINAIAWFVLVAIGYVFLIIPGLILHFCCVIGAGMGDPYR